ncbi:30S ribosomal protein S6 [Propionibacteriaceae bacterium Y2011]|uniref:30S ribosomal protein S6 n=1 Tax=Microlunatus sp. Y2014 TaxID=3418488 RepID=UPI003B4E7832
MRKYEVMVIIDPDIDDRQVQPTIDQHLKTVTNDGGTVDNVDIWGRRRLAYEINKKPEGIYAVIDLTCEPKTVKELERLMAINEQIVRTKVLRPDLH